MHFPTPLLLLLPLTTAKFTDTITGFFGDPVGLINSLPTCTRSCAAFALSNVRDDSCPGKVSSSATNATLSCFCRDGGKTWENATQACFAKIDKAVEEAKNKQDGDDDDVEMLTECKGEYQAGKVIDVCKAVGEIDAGDEEKRNETVEALMGMSKEAWDGVFKELEESINGTAKGSGAVRAGGMGGMGGVGGMVLVVAVGCAVAML